MRAASSRRRSPTARSAARRRLPTALLAVVLCGIVAYLVAPVVEKAIQHLTLPLAYQNIIRHQAAAKSLDPALIAAVIYAETRFDARTSPTGAEGLMQIEPATAEFLARPSGAPHFRVS